MTPVGFEPTTPAGERPQTYALDRAATGTGLGRKLEHSHPAGTEIKKVSIYTSVAPRCNHGAGHMDTFTFQLL